MNREHPDGAATFRPGPMTTRLEELPPMPSPDARRGGVGEPYWTQNSVERIRREAYEAGLRAHVATPQADRQAIKLLVAAGFVTEARANEALNIAHGFQPGPLDATPQAAQVPEGARELIEQCRDALAEELGAWDIDPPLAHVKDAHDACEAWLAAARAQGVG